MTARVTKVDMCGFAGILSSNAGLITKPGLEAMGNAIAHRGPDDHGSWIADCGQIGLSHRRLSIIDLSAAGHQPMASPSGRYVIAYNGEIYNHIASRNRLVGRDPSLSWRGHSDTETLLAGFDHFGVEETLRLAVGMFAMAVWDQSERTLILTRDRVGEKPLYYGWQQREGKRAFLFGSDLAALRCHSAFEGEEDPHAVMSFLRLGYVPTPMSIFKGIRKLEPGMLLRVSLDTQEPQLRPYWSAKDATHQPLFSGSPEEAVDALELVVSRAVSRQMISDVPLGAFLSGGVDSSTITALMQAQSETPIKTFSIGFGDSEHNEAVYAAAVAKHLGTDHHELYVTSDIALDVIPKLSSIYSEPFADSSQIPVYLVSKLARQSVTVALSGDAGDELFAGYNRYIMAARYFKRLQAIPSPIRTAIAKRAGAITPDGWTRLGKLWPGSTTLAKLAEKGPKMVRALSASGPWELYRDLVSLNPDALRLMRKHELPRQVANASNGEWGTDFVGAMMREDLVTYLPDDILCKVDRAAMAVSLETRVPLLDHEVVEFAWSLPLSIKLKDGIGKWPLRQLLYRHVPRELIERPKMGFSIPLDNWLRGPLRDWAQSLLTGGQHDMLDNEAIHQLWTEHLSLKVNRGSALWPILMYRSWRENN
jgi:asparagine synthase (glutamine-hydrolysing)